MSDLAHNSLRNETVVDDIVANDPEAEDFLRELAAFGGDAEATSSVEELRASAEQESRAVARRRVTSVAESKSGKILRKRTGKTMDGIKSHIKKARGKERMRTVSHFLCDDCNNIILNPEDGFVVQGNVYVADPSCRGGLIGNAFPDPDKDGKITAEEVRETVLCKQCLLSALGLDKSYSLRPGKRGV